MPRLPKIQDTAKLIIPASPGVGIIFLSLKFFTWLFSSHLGYDGFISGKYGNPPQALLQVFPPSPLPFFHH